MEYLVQFQLNIYAIIILLILCITLSYRSRVNHLGKQLFKAAIFFVGSAVIIEPLTWIFDGKTFFGAYFLEYATNFLLILLAPIICGLMLSYVDYYIFKDPKRIYKKYFYLWPTIFIFVLLIINIFSPIYFSVDKDTNLYVLADLHWIQYVMVGLYLLYMVGFSLVHRKKTFRHALVIFFTFFTLPLLGVILQLIDSEFFFTWTSIVLSLLVIYIFLESTSGEEDYLTKLYNRQTYEKYILHLIDREKPFSILFIDLDKFKAINDDFGHFKGDQVLVEFGRILKKVFGSNQLISRLGGDEFIVVIENEIDITKSIDTIYSNLKASKDRSISTLRFSSGFQAHRKNMTMDQLYVKADKKMYNQKEKNRNKE